MIANWNNREWLHRFHQVLLEAVRLRLIESARARIGSVDLQGRIV